MSTSQSFKSLEKRDAQQPPSSNFFQTSTTQASSEATIAKREGKVVQSGSSLHHLFFQNLTLYSLPTEKATLQAKRFQFFLMAFHNCNPYLSLTSLARHPPSTPYLQLITCFHKAPLFSA